MASTAAWQGPQRLRELRTCAGTGAELAGNPHHMTRVVHTYMLWLKAFHIIFVVTWFAGLFYLPRLFVNHVEAEEAVVRERLKIMQRRLLMITHIGGALALAFGLALMTWWLRHAHHALIAGQWFHLKLLCVLGLIAYHGMLVHLVRRFAEDRNTRSSRWLRLFNEIPAVLLIAIVVLVVVKPI
jgi:putative membrane protein